QYDSRSDRDRLFERNSIAIRTVTGKGGAPRGASCTQASVNAGGKVAGGCGLQGAFLANADLRGVSLAGARLDGGSLTGADLRTTDLTGASLVNVSTRGAVWSSDEQEGLAFPNDGEDIASAIDGAKSRVDIIIYTIGGPEIVGEASKPGALMRAVSRGVDVRVIINSGNKGCKIKPPADQGPCLRSYMFDSWYAIQQSLKTAQQNPLPPSKGGTGKAGNFEIRFSSQNFQITHQKTILIDAFDDKGEPSIGNGSLALVSTGNLDSFGVGSTATNKAAGWGTSRYNAKYLTNPSASCGGTKGCGEDWAARDFAVLVTDKELLQRIASVYASDANCDTWASSPVYSQLLNSTLPDTWANGTLLADGSSYPVIGSPAFYAGDEANPLLQATPQGNSRSRTLRLIDSAQKSLIVYNEEMADPDVMHALVRASRERKVDVGVVMSEVFCTLDPKQPPCVDGQPLPSRSYDYLTANGVKVTVLDKADSDTGAGLYIHAKAIVADGTDGFMGSENFGYGSMNANRELGLMLTNRADPTTVASGVPSIESVSGIAKIQSAFATDSDISTSGGVAYDTSKVYPGAPGPVQTYPWP
ncbi:MAG: phospholipase D-like domain-containing protein, partial [Actinomycetales bacterium]